MYTTLRKIKDCDPCGDGWNKLLKSLNKTEADDEPLPFSHILESNGLEDAIWAMRSAPEYDREWRLFAVFCARQVQYLMTDERSINAIDVAERYANGLATEKELAVASDAAWDVASGPSWGAVVAARATAGSTAWDTAGAAQKEYLTKLFNKQ